MRALLLLVVVFASFGLQLASGASGGRLSNGRYVVVPGDSLSVIAERFDVSLGQLAEANGLDVRAPLLVGTVLHLPGASEPPAPVQQRWSGVYVVRPGDTLGAISLHYGVPLGRLAKVNGMDPADVLLAGAKLTVPPADAAAAPSGLTVTVSPGDTLSGIAGRYGISLGALSAANHIDPNGLLLAGQRLFIPGSVSAAASLADIAAAEASPYPQAAAGLDVSYPDCARMLPAGLGFMVVGLNDGRPFTSNPCFETEYAAARASELLPSVYLNAAYAPSLIRHVTPDCASAGASQPVSRREQVAYAVGCSEAGAAEAMLAGLPAAALWIDVEPANSWSRRPALNRATILGLVSTLLAQDPRPVVGIYSGTGYWRGLTGAWSSLPLPEWIATGSEVDAYGCGIAFSGGPVWLSQHAASRRDHDRSC
jgi:LysM repeat protein